MEEQIKENEKTLTELKRSRNALLNISTLPPEVLGKIFQCNVILKDDFDGLEEGSHDFLFVCHHWHEVALRTPGVWSFWGNTPEDWARWYRRSGTAPLDLVLIPTYTSNDGGSPLDVALLETLQDALRDRAARDTIRRIHLSSEDASLLSSIISSLTTVCEGVRSNSVESLILVNGGEKVMDISDFLANYRFPKLQRLTLQRCKINSWDLLISRTVALTTLILRFDDSSLTPTTSQLLSILASNPALRKVSLSGHAIPNAGGRESHIRVPLHHLNELQLDGGLQHVLGLLHRLDHPRKMGHLDITLSDCVVPDIRQTIGPYLREHFRRRGRPRDGLGLRVCELGDRTWALILYAGDICGTSLPDSGVLSNRFVSVIVKLHQTPSDLLEKGVLDLIAHTPRDDVARFESSCRLGLGDISAQFPNLKELQFDTRRISLSITFPTGGDEGVLPSLQYIEIRTRPADDDWSPLVAFLARRASSGGRLGLLNIFYCHMCPEVKERIRSMVQVFYHVDFIGRSCPFGICPE